MTILDYSEKLQTYANGLRDLDQPVSDGTLLLTLLRGLNSVYRPMASIIKSMDLLPMFLEARSKLTLEESDLKVALPGQETALVVAPPSTPAAPAVPSSTSCPKNKNKNKGKGRGAGGAQDQPFPFSDGFRPSFNPWSGNFQMWPTHA